MRDFRKIFAVHRQRTATQTVYSTQSAAYPCRANPWHVVTHGICEFRCLVQFIFVGPVYNNALKDRAALLCRACEDFPVCVAVMYLTLRTGCERHGRKNPLPYSFSCLRSLPFAPKVGFQGKRVFKEGRNRRCLPSCPAAGRGSPPRGVSALPRRGARHAPAAAAAHSSLNPAEPTNGLQQ